MKTAIRSTSKNLVLGTILLATTALSMACAGTVALPRLSAQAGQNQQIVYEDGAEKIMSAQAGSIVSIRMGEPMSGRSTFVVMVANQSNRPIVIGPESFTVTQMGRSLRVLPFEEVASLERQRAETARRNQTMLSMLSTVQSMAGVPTSSLSTLQTSLQTAQRSLSTAVEAGLRTTASTAELNLKEVSEVALKKNTIFPEQMNGGVVYAEGRAAGPISVRVQVGQDAHDFQFTL